VTNKAAYLKRYAKTKRGLIVNLYSQQRASSVKRKSAGGYIWKS